MLSKVLGQTMESTRIVWLYQCKNLVGSIKHIVSKGNLLQSCFHNGNDYFLDTTAYHKTNTQLQHQACPSVFLDHCSVPGLTQQASSTAPEIRDMYTH